MKRALTFLFAVVSCWTVSFVQAANVGLNFYSGESGESVSVAKDLRFAIVNLDGEKIAKGNLDAESEGEVKTDVDANEFYVVAEQPSTRFFGSVLVNKGEGDGELFFILNASGLIWVKDAHSCADGDECVKEGADCDENCICHKLAEYREGNLKGARVHQAYADEAGEVEKDVVDVAQNARVATTPYSFGASNFGVDSSYGYGASNGRLAGLGMLGMVGAVIAIAVSDNESVSPVK